MKIGIISDLHLDSHNAPSEIIEDLKIDLKDCEHIIHVGDLTTRGFISKHKNYFGDKEFYVPGNHDYYDTGLSVRPAKDPATEHPKMRFLNEEWVLIGLPLWTYVPPTDEAAVFQGMADYAWIPDFTVEKMNQIHHAQRRTLLACLEDAKQKGLKIIVATHHAPSEKSISNNYKNHPLNCAFANNLDWIMHDYENIKYWIHGHVHSKFDYVINETRVLCNPLGYKGENNRAEYRPVIIEI